MISGAHGICTVCVASVFQSMSVNPSMRLPASPGAKETSNESGDVEGLGPLPVKSLFHVDPARRVLSSSYIPQSYFEEQRIQLRRLLKHTLQSAGHVTYGIIYPPWRPFNTSTDWKHRQLNGHLATTGDR